MAGYSKGFALHCDACHHEERFEGKLGRQHVGHPCPVCQSTMLTKRDYRLARALLAIVAVLRVLGLVREYDGTPVGPDEDRIRVRIGGGEIRARKL